MRGRLKRVLIPLSIVALVGVVTTGTASAKTINVKSGDSIQAAVDKAKEGDTINVAKGTYKENVEISKNGITLVGKNATIVPPSKPHKGSVCWAPKDKSSHSGICIVPKDFDFENFALGSDPAISGTSVSGFTFKGFTGNGIIAFGAEDTEMTDNTSINAGEYGFAAFVSTGTTITGNSATAKGGEAGIYIGSSPDSQAVVRDNTSKGAANGIFLRDAKNATFEDNELTGNCIGILVLGDSPGPVGDSTITNNKITKNDKFCPAEDEGPANGGVGIAIASGSGITATGNTITDNKVTQDAQITGGVVVVAPPGENGAGTPPDNNSFTGNTISGNNPDIVYDGSGSGNTFTGNTGCTTSQPEGLCAG